ncbi:MAG TPA: MBL fold metallo-hydrolase [Pseudolabrys sp.]|nr:MBL fold metallo-hydrolase [Pseudolabrys sp.]
MKIDDYDIDIVVQGFPGKSVCHGGLGWSTVVLIRAHGRTALIDAGSFSMRTMLLKRLTDRGLKPKDVTDVLLTHSHHDHAVNWVLFSHARIVLGAEELAWSLTVPWGETPVPELYVRELERWPTLHRAAEGEEVFPGITAHLAPGHTPGSLVFVLHGAERDVIFTGDAAKNRAELVSGTTDMTYDPAISKASIEMIWSLWRKRPGSIVVPGHDMPMRLESGKTKYIDKREAAIVAWYGDDMETTTLFRLTS